MNIDLDPPDHEDDQDTGYGDEVAVADLPTVDYSKMAKVLGDLKSECQRSPSTPRAGGEDEEVEDRDDTPDPHDFYGFDPDEGEGECV